MIICDVMVFITSVILNKHDFICIMCLKMPRIVILSGCIVDGKVVIFPHMQFCVKLN